MKLRRMHTPRALYIACTMTRPDDAINASTLGLIHRKQGFSRIAVHHVIRRCGAVDGGRDPSLPGALIGAPSESLQVSLVGGINDAMEPDDNFTAQQIESLRSLIAQIGLPVVFAPERPLQQLKDRYEFDPPSKSGTEPST